MTSQPDTAKLVNEYLLGFHKHYKLPRYFDDENFLVWCRDNLGKEYRDWSFYKGHKKDPWTVIHIKNPKWCIIFELTWGHLIQGTLNIQKH
jgi:hypothetical protein